MLDQRRTPAERHAEALAAASARAAPPSDTLVIYQGDDYTAVVHVVDGNGDPANLTGYTAKAQIRRDVADNDVDVDAEFTTSISGADVTLTLGHAVTVDLEGAYVWDCQLTDGAGKIQTVIAGDVTVIQEVTR